MTQIKLHAPVMNVNDVKPFSLEGQVASLSMEIKPFLRMWVCTKTILATILQWLWHRAL